MRRRQRDRPLLRLHLHPAYLTGDLIRIESELLYVSGKSTNDLTVVRAQNGSSAATHAEDTAVTIWQPMSEIHLCCLEIASNAYSRRFGQNQSGATVTTPAGLVIGPADVTETARKTLDKLSRRV